MSARRRTSQASVGLVVAGLHLAGVLVWWTADRGMQLVRNEPRLQTIAVWLPALVPLETRKAEPAIRPPRAQTPGDEPDRRTRRPAEPEHTATVTTAPASVGIPMPAATPGSAELQSPAQTAPALNLNLSRKTITSVAPPSFAEQSPFRGRLPVTVERQIATAAAETGPWTEERVDNDRIRFRRGNTCINLERPRAATIDPFSEAAARIPWRASQPEDCQ